MSLHITTTNSTHKTNQQPSPLRMEFHLIPTSNPTTNSPSPRKQPKTKPHPLTRLLHSLTFKTQAQPKPQPKPRSRPQCLHRTPLKPSTCPTCAYLADQALDTTVRQTLLTKGWTKPEVSATPVYMFKRSRVADLKAGDEDEPEDSARDEEFRVRVERSEEWLVERHGRRVWNEVVVESEEEEGGGRGFV